MKPAGTTALKLALILPSLLAWSIGSAAGQSVTVAPAELATPALGIGGLILLALGLAGLAWWGLRAGSAIGRLAMILALAGLGAVGVRALSLTVLVSGDDCTKRTELGYAADSPIDLESQCDNAIRVEAIDLQCGGAPETLASVVARACEVGTVLQTGDRCELPYCPSACDDNLQNGDETGVDCGGSCLGDCALGGGCESGTDCTTGTCTANVCTCPSHTFTFTINSNVGGTFDSAEWPGGTASQTATTGCGVTINRPSGNIDLVGSQGNAFSVSTFTGFSSCAGNGGEDGDGCQPLTCPSPGIGSCLLTRPACSVGTSGSGSATYRVACNP